MNLARNNQFKEQPIVLFLDEAHQFLNKSVVDNYFASSSLSAFDQIAKECRKYGLFLCLATQMPRDIPIGTLSQIGTFIIHRLINYNEVIEFMAKNKAEWALRVFDSEQRIIYPEYIQNVINEFD